MALRTLRTILVYCPYVKENSTLYNFEFKITNLRTGEAPDGINSLKSYSFVARVYFNLLCLREPVAKNLSVLSIVWRAPHSTFTTCSPNFSPSFVHPAAVYEEYSLLLEKSFRNDWLPARGHADGLRGYADTNILVQFQHWQKLGQRKIHCVCLVLSTFQQDWATQLCGVIFSTKFNDRCLVV